MKKTKLSSTMRKIITIIVAVSIGNLFTDILYQADINVWFARVAGCGICVLAGLVLHRLWCTDNIQS